MKFLFVVLVLVPLLSTGQERRLTDAEINNSGVLKLNFVGSTGTCVEAVQLAQQDIGNQTPFLIIAGGIGPVQYASDGEFQREFGVYYYDEGCTAPSTECMVAYNTEVFQHLTQLHGKKWMKSIRRDVVGFKKWKAKS